MLIITTRDKRKGDATIEKLEQHLRKVINDHERLLPGISQVLRQRVYFRQERLDLTSLVSVQRLCKRLQDTTPKLHAIICNAGIGGWTGLNWPLAIWTILTSWKNSLTWPKFKVSGLGWVTKPQLVTGEEPPLGEVFCANIFGHYLLGHYLAPLLSNHTRKDKTTGRLIWVSSLEAYEHVLNIEDPQGLKSHVPYESSKRLTDVMAITSTVPGTSDLVDSYLGHAQTSETTTKPRIYVTHPGICGTSILALPLILEYLMFAAMFMARWLGSPWHPVTADKGATAMVWLALAKQSTLDTMEQKEGVGKWGSATDFWGQERVERTEVAGWGWGGKEGELQRKHGRDPYAKTPTKDSRERFLREGRKCWEDLERLRLEWEERLRANGVGIQVLDG